MTHSKYIFKKKSRIHGYGIFAKMDIPQGTRIIEYIGEKITKVESERRGPLLIEYAKDHHERGAVYIFELNKKYDIDGHVYYNTAKYINHSCDPNCEAEIIRGHIWIIAKHDILRGQELFYNYGYDLATFEDHPCRCGSARCVGYIVDEDHWPDLKKKLLCK
jgi:SET domain-containing protein